jgi:hypothetical protein
MADARVDPALREQTVAVLAKWMGAAPVSMDSAERWLWKGDAEKAIELLRGVRNKSKDSLPSLQKAAEMLGSTDNKQAQQAGVALWDELASGFQQGSNAWHEAKLSAIGLLQRIGERQEAYRRAKFVLLTQVSMSDDIRRRYQSVEKP